nr:MAG TPA: hypothetical protein [Caudoviricetes sp.]
MVKALALQYRQSKTGFLLLAWIENYKSQHYKMNYPYQVMVALNRETSFIVLAISLFYLSMFATTSPPSLFSRCKYRYNFSYYQTFGAILIHFNLLFCSYVSPFKPFMSFVSITMVTTMRYISTTKLSMF